MVTIVILATSSLATANNTFQVYNFFFCLEYLFAILKKTIISFYYYMFLNGGVFWVKTSKQTNKLAYILEFREDGADAPLLFKWIKTQNWIKAFFLFPTIFQICIDDDWTWYDTVYYHIPYHIIMMQSLKNVLFFFQIIELLLNHSNPIP